MNESTIKDINEIMEANKDACYRTLIACRDEAIENGDYLELAAIALLIKAELERA